MNGQDDGAPAQTLHATTVSFHNRGVLIVGPSGAGKSALALQLMALGAALVSDDRTRVWLQDGLLMAVAPPGLPAAIEARGLGLLRVPVLAPAVPLHLAVDMGQLEVVRLPPPRHMAVMGLSLPLVFRVDGPHFCPAVLHHLIHGRHA